jgi:glutamate/tyrosine decarboxylase-like PLP-dependent enzyme
VQPQTLETEMTVLRDAVASLAEAHAGLPAWEEPVDWVVVSAVLQETAVRLGDSYPFHHPLYAGQMLKPPHPVARLAYALAQRINPNNHALDGGPATSAMEKEAVAELAAMVGWTQHLGHLCGGGTLANLEALWIAGRLQPGRRVLASRQAHYTHARLCEVLGIPFTAVEVDAEARMDLDALAAELARGDVGTVVATLGTTALGAVDPLSQILDLARAHGCRVHVDAAYGGYFRLVNTLDAPATAAFAALPGADSCVIDPHKHGLQPYGCGCVLFRDPAVGQFYKHDSPYTYFTSDDLHLGEISLECSRPGAAAAALWATQRLLPLVPGGEFASGLAAGRAAALALHARVRDDTRFLPVLAPQLDIVAWAPAAATASEISRRTRRLFARAAARELHLSVAAVPAELLASRWPGVRFDEPRVSCLRACLMKPAHREWLDEIWRRLLLAHEQEEHCAWK